MWRGSVVTDSGHIVIFITTPTNDEADKIADYLNWLEEETSQWT